MSESKLRRILDQEVRESTEIGVGFKLIGNLYSNGRITLYGEIVGDCEIDGQLVITEKLTDFSYVLSGDELGDGMILACQSYLRSDVTVHLELAEVKKTASRLHTSDATIVNTQHLTHDILTVTIRLDKPFVGIGENATAYLAGQYAEITISGIDKPRAYSFATASTRQMEDVTFFIRKVPGGEFTDWLFDKDRIGSRVTVTGPYGSFYLRDKDCPVICIAGGSGMSAIKALLDDAANSNCPRDVIYLFGARTRKDLYCLEGMRDLTGAWNHGASFKFIPVLSEEPDNTEWDGLRGFVTEHIRSQPIDLESAQAYLCGPPPIIDAAIKELEEAGVSSEDTFFDKFLDASSMPGGR